MTFRGAGAGATIALIPARGGSKGLPDKNIRSLHGKPMIQYTIDAALQCAGVDAVYVSTDSAEIADVAQAGGALLPPLRPADLATDTASSADVVRHFLQWYQSQAPDGQWPDTLVLLQPTSPLRTAAHVQEALALYEAHRGPETAVVGVTRGKPLAWQGLVQADTGRFVSHQVIQTGSNRQMEPANYVLNGAVYVAAARRFWDNALMSGAIYPLVMSADASVDVDTLLDFQLAELILAEGARLPVMQAAQEPERR